MSYNCYVNIMLHIDATDLIFAPIFINNVWGGKKHKYET